MSDVVMSDAEVRFHDYLACLKDRNGPLTPYDYREFLMHLIRGYYSEGGNLPATFRNIECMKYPDNLHVGMSHVFDMEDTSEFPGIFVSPADRRFQRAGIADHSGVNDVGDGSHKVRVTSTIIRLAHVSSSTHLTEMAAEQTAEMLMGMSSFIMDKLQLADFEVTGYVGASKVSGKSPSTFYKIDLGVRMLGEVKTTYYLESLRLKKLETKTSTK